MHMRHMQIAGKTLMHINLNKSTKELGKKEYLLTCQINWKYSSLTFIPELSEWYFLQENNLESKQH